MSKAEDSVRQAEQIDSDNVETEEQSQELIQPGRVVRKSDLARFNEELIGIVEAVRKHGT